MIPFGFIGVGDPFDCEVVRLCAAAGEYDLVLIGTDKRRHLVSSVLDSGSGFGSGRMDAGRVAREFAEKGFRKVYNLAGGIKAWKKDGFPVDKGRLKGSKAKRQKR